MAVIKICGLKTEEAAKVAVNSGTNLLGMILVPNRERTIDIDVAKSIAKFVREERLESQSKHKTINSLLKELYSGKYEHVEQFQERAAELLLTNGPFLSGVFRNQNIDDVFKLAREIDLDIIQLHGSEDKLEYGVRNANEDLQFGIIPRFVIPQDIVSMKTIFESKMENGILLPLLDSEAGGEGKKIDWDQVGKLKFGKYILAGGLTPDNVNEALAIDNVIGVDVSGGVETNKVKDHSKIENFLKNAK